MDTTIREANFTEYETVAELVNKAYAVPFTKGALVTKANDSPEKIALYIKRGCRVLVADIGGRMVGSVRYCFSGRYVSMDKLATDPDFRNMGIGRRLIAAVFNAVKSLGAEALEIEVAEAKGLVPYYQTLGFLIKERKFVKDHYEVKMTKKV